MENFSTPRQAMVPRIANLATLAAVVAATWWSGAQRPVDTATEAALQAPALTPAAQSGVEAKPILPALTTPAPVPAAVQVHWATQGQPLSNDSLQAVGFSATTRR